MSETSGAGGSGDEHMVPKSRLDEVIAQKNEALAQLSKANEDNSKLAAAGMGYKQRLDEALAESERLKGLTEGIDDLDNIRAQGKRAVELQEELDRLKEERKGDAERFKRERLMLAKGVDDEDIMDVALRKFSKQADDGEGDFEKWWKAEVKRSPKYLGLDASSSDASDDGGGGGDDAGDAGDAGGDDAGDDAGKGKLPGNQGTIQTPKPGDPQDPVAIAKMSRDDFAKSGLLDSFR